jgi:hypothetical protein
MSFAWYDVVGFSGTLMILGAFAAQQMGKLRGDSPPYQLLNLFGAAGVLISLLGTFNISVFVLESAWVLVSAYGLWRGMRRSSTTNP